MRLFLSINFDAINLLHLEKWQYDLRERGVKGFWRNRDNLHITLKFLDEVKKENLDSLVENLKPAADFVGTFNLRVKALGLFPNSSNPRILWAGISREPNLFLLKKEIETRCADLGFAPENRDYKPHLTLASGGIKGITQKIMRWGDGLSLEQEVREFHLMNSIIADGRRRYEVVKSFRLKH